MNAPLAAEKQLCDCCESRCGSRIGQESPVCLHDEIARLEYIQRDFHNVGDVAEITRLRNAINNYVRTKLANAGENVHYWYTLQEIAKEDPKP